MPPVSVFCKRDPPSVLNSEAYSDGVSSIVYTCAHGYFLSGNSHISTCDRDTGAWSDVDITCTFVNCGTPPVLHGAVVRGPCFTLDAKTLIGCGYVLPLLTI